MWDIEELGAAPCQCFTWAMAASPHKCRRELLLPLLKDILHHGQRRKGTRPTRIEGELRQHSGGLFLCQTVVHGTTELTGDLSRLSVCNRCADRDQTPITTRSMARSTIGTATASLFGCSTAACPPRLKMPTPTTDSKRHRSINIRESDLEEAQRWVRFFLQFSLVTAIR